VERSLVSDYFHAWLMWCWLSSDPDWIVMMGPTSFEEYLAILASIPWDVYPPETAT
jgi:hypothetical protein